MSTTPADNADIADLSFEAAQEQLEQIVERLEDQHTGLEEAMALWERGERLHAHCQAKLEYAAERIERLTVSADEAAAAAADDSDDFAQREPQAVSADAPAESAAPANGDSSGAPTMF